jgi:hypothetical protein
MSRPLMTMSATAIPAMPTTAANNHGDDDAYPPLQPNQADGPTSILMLPAPGTPGEHYFEGWRSSSTYLEERREWFIKNYNFFIE